mmetsp:Transcript_23574/g.23231  ORF Transcript_23574/g.23231 Transcript_23574/m.23231 type:complete len:128 (+) Transcript_23574:775-1158(+)
MKAFSYETNELVLKPEDKHLEASISVQAEKVSYTKKNYTRMQEEIEQNKDIRKQYCTVDWDYDNTKVTQLFVHSQEPLANQTRYLKDLINKYILAKVGIKVEKLVVDFIFDSKQREWLFLQIKSIVF